jgi:hypothetical protein
MSAEPRWATERTDRETFGPLVVEVAEQLAGGAQLVVLRGQGGVLFLELVEGFQAFLQFGDLVAEGGPGLQRGIGNAQVAALP